MTATQEKKTDDRLTAGFDGNSTASLNDILPASERTRSIEVMERIVAFGDNNKPHELGNPTTVYVRPLTTMRWLRAMECLGEVIENLPIAGGINFSDPAQLAILLMKLLGTSREAVVAIACMSIDKEPEFFDRIDLDEGMKIFVAVTEVNSDFFVQKVLPLISELLPKAKQAVEDTFGQTLSPFSSAQDTDTTTSSDTPSVSSEPSANQQ